MGRDHTGQVIWNCFTVTLRRQGTFYLPYRFADFIADFNRKHPGTCTDCIAKHAQLTYRVEGRDIDRSAVDKKFAGQENDVTDPPYYYCPRVEETIASSDLRFELSAPRLEARPPTIRAILSGNWDDEYYFEYSSIRGGPFPGACKICAELSSKRFLETHAERAFMRLWFSAMHLQMDRCRSGQAIYLDDEDFDYTKSKLFSFLLPIPQTWVYVVPGHPPGTSWTQRGSRVQGQPGPQRVDFLLIHEGTRHAIELDDVGHYGSRPTQGRWAASEESYRRTLSATRALQSAGYRVHRFTNEEVVALLSSGPAGKEDPEGFIALLRSAGLKAEEMVFLPNHA